MYSNILPQNWVPKYTFGGTQIPDFSHAGYNYSNSSFPTPYMFADLVDYGADRTGYDDCSALMRQALADANTYVQSLSTPIPVVIGLGLRDGKGGKFRFMRQAASTNECISIDYPYVGIQGAGWDKTFIFYDPCLPNGSTPSWANRRFIQGGSGDWESLCDATEYLLTADMDYGDNSFTLTDASAFSVGDFGLLEIDFTADLIADLDASLYWGGANPVPENPQYLFRVIGKSGNTITIDSPINVKILMRDTARVKKLISDLPLHDIYIGDFSMSAVLPANAQYADLETACAGHAMLSLSNSRDSIIDNVRTFCLDINNTALTRSQKFPIHIPSNGIQTNYGFCLTISNCYIGGSAHQGENGNGYLYQGRGRHILIKDCIAANGRRNFSSQDARTSNLVELRNTSIYSSLQSDKHRHAPNGNLIDSCQIIFDEFNCFNRGTNGSPPVHGQTGWNNWCWNFICHQPDPEQAGAGLRWKQVIRGGVVGTRGKGYVESSGTEYREMFKDGELLEPQSVFEFQLAKRKGLI